MCPINLSDIVDWHEQFTPYLKVVLFYVIHLSYAHKVYTKFSQTNTHQKDSVFALFNRAAAYKLL